MPEDSIPRIAEEVSYIRNCPQGDVPNVQIDGWRTQSTKGVPITDGMKITFHTQSLPTARLVWHCPFVSIFTSENGCDLRSHPAQVLSLCVDHIPFALDVMRLCNK